MDAEPGFWSMECGIEEWKMESGIWDIWNIEYEARDMEYGLWSMECDVWRIAYGVWSLVY